MRHNPSYIFLVKTLCLRVNRYDSLEVNQIFPAFLIVKNLKIRVHHILARQVTGHFTGHYNTHALLKYLSQVSWIASEPFRRKEPAAVFDRYFICLSIPVGFIYIAYDMADDCRPASHRD